MLKHESSEIDGGIDYFLDGDKDITSAWSRANDPTPSLPSILVICKTIDRVVAGAQKYARNHTPRMQCVSFVPRDKGFRKAVRPTRPFLFLRYITLHKLIKGIKPLTL
jgi:hypothetical protein